MLKKVLCTTYYIGNVLTNALISLFAEDIVLQDFICSGALFHTLAESLIKVFFALLDPLLSIRLDSIIA